MRIWQPIIFYYFNVPMPCMEYVMADHQTNFPANNVEMHCPESLTIETQNLDEFNSLLLR